ncbi:MAG: cupin domain-containing protein [Flavitalea sp.]
MKTISFFSLLVIAGLLLAYTPGIKVNTFDGKAVLKNFAKPDEVREFPLGKLELVKINGAIVGRATFQPGWKWSTSVQPIAKTKSCEAPHFQYHVSGILKVQMDDGNIFECKPGDISLLPQGHDAWVVGNEPVVVVDFHGMIDYSKTK